LFTLDDLGEGLDVRIDDVVAGEVGLRGLQHDEPRLEVAAIEEDRLLGGSIAPVGRRIVEGGGRRAR